MTPSIDPSKPWRLSHILEGHTSDVKSVYTSALDEGIELIHSASRDETGRSWFRDVLSNPSEFQKSATYQGKRYQNAVAHLEKSSTMPNGLTMLGGLDSKILVYDTKSSYSEKPLSASRQILQSHYDNVCHLSVYDGRRSNSQTLLISSSWDCTSRVWRFDEQNKSWIYLHNLKGHERAVWAAKVINAKQDNEQYLTVSADLFVRLFHGEQLKKIYAGHTDVIRSVALLPVKDSRQADIKVDVKEEEIFVTASNDGSLRVWSLDDKRCPPGQPTNGGNSLKILKSESTSDILYDVKYAGQTSETNDRVIISCGEDGVLRGWDVDNGTIIFSIPQPVTSVWALAILPHSGDLVTANSDGKVRIFTQRDVANTNVTRGDAIREVSEEDLKLHKEQCDYIIASKEKNSNDTLEEAENKTQDNIIDGRQYDIVVGIDVNDDSDPLPFGINKGDDISLAVQQFIQTHSLPTSYEDQIVAFIQQVIPR